MFVCNDGFIGCEAWNGKRDSVSFLVIAAFIVFDYRAMRRPLIGDCTEQMTKISRSREADRGRIRRFFVTILRPRAPNDFRPFLCRALPSSASSSEEGGSSSFRRS